MSEGVGMEFSHIVRLDELDRIAWPITITADARQCAALARRFGFDAIDTLEADIALERQGTGWLATGQLRAALAQPCVATGEPVPERIKEPFSIRFEREGTMAGEGTEHELEIDAQDADVVEFSGERIDLGEAMAETLALAVNPYPRSADADAWLNRMGVKSEEEAGPFAALAALKKTR